MIDILRNPIHTVLREVWACKATQDLQIYIINSSSQKLLVASQFEVESPLGELLPALLITLHASPFIFGLGTRL